MSSLLAWVVGGIGFAVGVGVIPVIIYSTVGVLPAFIAEPVASMLFMIGNLGCDGVVLRQRSDGDYEFVEATQTAGIDPRCWARFGLADFAIDVEVSAETWDHHSLRPDDVDRLQRMAEDIDVPGPAADGGDRGAGRTYIPLDINDADVVVRALNVLSKIGRGPGARTMQQASTAGEKRYGGDTAQFGPVAQLAGYAIFAGLGFVTGIVIFGAPAVGL